MFLACWCGGVVVATTIIAFRASHGSLVHLVSYILRSSVSGFFVVSGSAGSTLHRFRSASRQVACVCDSGLKFKDKRGMTVGQTVSLNYSCRVVVGPSVC